MSEASENTAEVLGEFPVAAYNQALAKVRKGDWAAARDHLLVALQLEAQFVPALVLLGKVYAQMGDLPSAVACWQKALTGEPDNAAARAALNRATRLLNTRRLRQRGEMILRIAIVGGLLATGAWLHAPFHYLTRPTPTEAEGNVMAAWASAPGLAGLHLGANASGSGIKLTGTVPTPAHRDLAAALARSCSGEPVDPAGLVVETPSPAEALAGLCARGSCPWLRDIRVEGAQGKILLSGLVPTREDKAWLVSLGQVLAGADQVDASQIVVLSPVRVRFGRRDTLWGLAERYYGDGCRWPDIQANNPDLPSNPRRIPTGIAVQVILDRNGSIPACLRTTQTLPAEAGTPR